MIFACHDELQMVITIRTPPHLPPRTLSFHLNPSPPLSLTPDPYHRPKPLSPLAPPSQKFTSDLYYTPHPCIRNLISIIPQLSRAPTYAIFNLPDFRGIYLEKLLEVANSILYNPEASEEDPLMPSSSPRALNLPIISH